MKKVIIVGGVAGGASTAARLRRLDENIEIILFEKGEYISFANCGLPYYIGETIKDRSKLLIQTKEEMSKKFNMDIRNLSEVISIDREAKEVTVKEIETGKVYKETYDVLVLSPGAKPVMFPISGIENAKNLFTLRNIPDTDKIKAHVDNNDIKNAVVIGGGFIGIEMIENLVERGINVTLVQLDNQVMPPIDFEMATIVHDHLREKGVNLIFEDTVEMFEDEGKLLTLKSGLKLNSDLTIFSIGVKPESKIAKDAGLELNQRGAIIVDEYMRTSDSNIYALGDAVEVRDFINGGKTMIPLAWPANRQGRLVADNICGRDARYNGTMGSSVAKVFDLTVASTGNSEKLLKRLGIEYKAIHIQANSHAGYYPGAFPVYIKLLFNSEGDILGAQGVGLDGVEKRIDVIATAIKGGIKAYDLADLELCYAPPYSSAKDPVNMAGYVVSNVLEGDVKVRDIFEVDSLIENGEFILDVRNKIELSSGVIKSSYNIPLGELRERISEIPKDKVINIHCKSGLRSYLAYRILVQNGFECRNIDGGYDLYSFIKREQKAQRDDREDRNENGILQEVAVTNRASETSREKIQVENKVSKVISVDACGLQCPGPIRRVYEEIEKIEDGDILEVKASDSAFKRDIKSWCDSTGNELLESSFSKEEKCFNVKIKKSITKEKEIATEEKDGATLVVFSGELDKAIASFIIATGAASMGKKVTMFFTFWGLNILKKGTKENIKKEGMEKMFDMMLPSHAGKLPLSKMNMGGMGAKMIKGIMEKNNVDSLETMIENAIKLGVKLVACSMSMDLMGIKKEELIDGVEIAGVATYLGDTEKSGLNLFI
ncbi:FAD-dependent oxidoreductase [Clostridium mediterraneense]|uniref:FAD-dependent oxidoreductase n=1 Tax=Clostridium mediterraneense TaxID=1805472 RepID=UPI000831395D|nr:FAD-dependent oxidoreductase [Clostridium mediterraneense]